MLLNNKFLYLQEKIMKKVLFFLILLPFFSCQKNSIKPTVNVSIIVEIYKTTVNGTYGDYWKITVAIDKTIDEDIKIDYFINDGVKSDLYQSIQKNTLLNIFTTQLKVNGNIISKGITQIIGGDKYNFNTK